MCLLTALLFLPQIQPKGQEEKTGSEVRNQTDASKNEQGRYALDETQEISSGSLQNQQIYSTILELESVRVPENNPRELAMRVGGFANVPVQKKEIPLEKAIGLSQDFWVLNVDDNHYQQIKAKLEYQTLHLNFWIEEGVGFDYPALAALAEVFENQIYPINREFFGSEWSPGVDNDIRLTILFAENLGYVAGYFSATDLLLKQLESYSNEAEMFYLCADFSRLDDVDTYGVLAHEFQHMIHWNVDRNETAWINEGLSELAVDINGYDVGDFGFLFALNPDLQLTFWPGNEQGDSTPHYGASYLFMRYLLDRFGKDFIQSIVSHEENGLASIDKVLFSSGNYGLGSETVFQDWTIANYLQDRSIAGGIYGYKEGVSVPGFYPTETLGCNSGWLERSVNQFGTDYIEVTCEGDAVVEITGAETVSLVPADPHSGDYYFWSNTGDESDMRLFRTFDLTDTKEPVELTYWTWFDIEKDYDYLYVLASIDGNEWKVLEPTSCTNADPTGANFGCGYNGKSNGWVRETINLSDFTGEKFTIQFEYVTDAAVNGEGFLLDDVELEAINYSTDFELDDGGWINEGFVRVQNTLPQKFAVAVVDKSSSLSPLKIDTDGKPESTFYLENPSKNNHQIITISGLTRYTRQPAVYSIRITEQK